jgi:membrane-bound lytic murein transglycosylase D
VQMAASTLPRPPTGSRGFSLNTNLPMGERMRLRSAAPSQRWRGLALGAALAWAGAAAPALADPPSEVLAPLAGATGPAGMEPPTAAVGDSPRRESSELRAADAPARRSLAARQPDFPKSPRLAPRVEFWKRIYSEVDTAGGLLHDSEDLSIVYEVVRLPEAGLRLDQERFLRQRREHYQGVLRRLAGGRRTDLDADERRVLALFPPEVSNETLRRAAGQVRFQLGQADKFRAGLIRQGRWEAYMRGVFAERGMPVELASLPHVESSFNPSARSHVGASGLWQFTRSTGRIYMRVDHVVDERNDPWLATVAASRLLASNHQKTKSWPLALTGYNHGVGGMDRAARTLGTRDMATIIDRYRSRSFGFASKNFYCEFLAALEVEENAERYFGQLVRDPPDNPEVTVLAGYYRPAALAAAFGVTLEGLRAANMGLTESVWKGQRLIPSGYALRIPRNPLRPAPEVVLASIAAERHVEQVREATYRVRRGDTLSRIAARFGVRTQELMAANGIRRANKIRVGQVLEIPGGTRATAVAAASPAAAPTVRNVSTAPASSAGSYRVRSGDTLGRIAKRHGVSERTLADVNGIRNKSLVKVGQVLRIPGAAGGAVAAPGGVYTVRRGDTIESIARKHGVAAHSIVALNGLANKHRIKAGQRLYLPES